LGEDIKVHVAREKNLFEAIINGANLGVKLIVGIVALLIAVLGLVALLDQVLGYVGGHLNSLMNLNFDWSLKGLLGIIFYPLTAVLGVPLEDVAVVSKIIGERVIVTELTAYQDLAVVIAEFKKQKILIELIDPKEIELALPGKGESSQAECIQKIVSGATGVVLATPEYHGSYSSVIKLVIDNLGYPSELSGKPIALLGVAAGQIGAIKALEHLRSVCSHVGAIVLPGPVSVANVNSIFDDQGKCIDKKMDQRIRSVATNLIDYINKSICPSRALEDFVREEN